MTGHTTSRDDFERLHGTHRVIPVIRELFADSETPVGIYRKLADGRPGSFLLESAEQGGIWSRYSFIGVSSFGTLAQYGDRTEWVGSGMSAEVAFDGPVPERGLDALRALHAQWQTPKVPGHPPLTGGLVGFIGWDAVRQLEDLPHPPASDFDFPTMAMGLVSDLVIVDHRDGLVLLVVSVLDAEWKDADAAWSEAQGRLDELQNGLAEPSDAWLAELDMSAAPEPVMNMSREAFHDMIETGKRHIHDGDVFQVVLSQRFDHRVTGSPIDVYRVLRALNPSPYMYLFALTDEHGEPYWIVGSSPEALVKVTDGRAFTHPIAGSRPRGATPERDGELGNELLADAKERAEHLMLVDLARNDLARVCEAGSVEVTEFMLVERYSHIMHLVSSVEGTLRDDVGPVDVFASTFPAGTLSGAPKPRALEIIDELEPSRRGLYGGVVGYLGLSGDLDLAIAIRTMTISQGIARVQAGAGVVADSDAETEYQESRNKAAAPLRAVAIANSIRRVTS